MNMSAHLLSRFCCTECSNDWYLRRAQPTSGPRIAAERRVEIGGRRLVVVDAIQAKAKRLHDDTARVQGECRKQESCILFELIPRRK